MQILMDSSLNVKYHELQFDSAQICDVESTIPPGSPSSIFKKTSQ